MRYLMASVFLCVIILAACSNVDIAPPDFSGARAMGYLNDQVALGPRVPGTPASEACRRYMSEHFVALGLNVDSQAFTFLDPYTMIDSPLVNIIAGFSTSEADAPTLILVAHYDSRPRAEHAVDSSLRSRPIDGANDGASGVAVLMELANLFSERPPPCNIDLVLVDGEDWGMTGDTENYCLGSRYFAARGIRGKYRFGIIVDMVGDSKQDICREAYSQKFNPELNDFIWETAARLNVQTFKDSIRHAMIDDHIPLNVGGIPSVVIIDNNYPYWHTEFDTPDKCSAQSLESVGKVLAEIIYKPSRWPKLK